MSIPAQLLTDYDKAQRILHAAADHMKRNGDTATEDKLRKEAARCMRIAQQTKEYNGRRG